MASERQIELAFNKGVASIVDAARVTALRDALRRGDLEAVLAAVDIEDAAFDEMRGLLVQTYAESGQSEISGMKFRQPIRWNSANPRVEDYARNIVGQRITYITEDMRAAVRYQVADGYAFGRSIDRMALDIVGRVGKNGRRQGGIVGLNFQQSQWIANMRQVLLSDDPSKALRYGLRDKRFDAALKSGKKLTAAQVDNMTRQYSNKLLLSRGRMIARTERGSSINLGRQEAWRQAADKVGFDVNRIKKTWVHTNRAMKDRPSHIAMNGETVTGLDTPFIVDGWSMVTPHDTSAPADQTINCMCEVKYSIGGRNG